jgi:E2/UBC family protein E
MAQNLDTRLRISRLHAESAYVGQRHGKVTIDQEDGTWFLVHQFRIPIGWNKSTVSILIDVPSGSPGYPQVPPDWFWTDKDLMTDDGRPIGHFFTGHGSSYVNADYDAKGWGHFCIHPRSWRPSTGGLLLQGDSLITYLGLISSVFRDRKKLAS